MNFKDTFWYKQRLTENSKPKPMTHEEKELIGLDNKAIIKDAKRIVAHAIKRGWISYGDTETVVPYDKEKF